MKPENRPKIEFDGKEYDDYQATQMQRRIERSIRKQKRLKTAYEAAGLKEDATAANIKLRRLNQKYKEFSKAAGLPEQMDRIKAYTPKTYAGKLASGDFSMAEPGKPIQIGSIDFSDKKAVLEQLDIAEKETDGLDYEVNYSVTSDGKIWRVAGQDGTVDPSSIPSSLAGSYGYHNHPRYKTLFSFSEADVRFFFKSGELYSKASDYLFEYIMKKTKDTLAIDPDVVYHRFIEIYNTQVLGMAFDGGLDIDKDGYHKTMELLSKELRFYYERKAKLK